MNNMAQIMKVKGISITSLSIRTGLERAFLEAVMDGLEKPDIYNKRVIARGLYSSIEDVFGPKVGNLMREEAVR